jgi:hypothetical protein
MPKPESQPDLKRRSEEFQRQANEPPPGLVAEFIDFLLHNKKWWLTPIILVLLLVSLFVVLTATTGGAAPFIYLGLF